MTTAVQTTSPREVLQRLQATDFSLVRRTLTEEHHLTTVEAEYRIAAFRQWFSLVLFVPPGTVYVMLKTPVDDAFHACVLNTAFYRDLCADIIGEFVDHTPIDPQTAAQLEQGVYDTLDLLEHTYGDDLHPALREWRHLVESGNYAVSCVGCSGDAAMANTVVGHLSNGTRVVH